MKEIPAEVEKKDGVEALAIEGGNDENSLTRTPCHDSGIDIRDALPTVPIIPTKKVRRYIVDVEVSILKFFFSSGFRFTAMLTSFLAQNGFHL